jgi:hypothetical protein
MSMNDLQFPSSYVRLIAALRKGGWPYFALREKVDAFGNHFDNGLKIVVPLDDTRPARAVSYRLIARFLRRSGTTSVAERPEEVRAASAGGPGFIPPVTDYTGVLFFGTGGERRGPENSLYAFDYRDSSSAPSVICWQSGYWRRVAPDAETFLALFELAPNRFRETDVGYWEMEEARIARTVKALSRM